jgi:hypothetical protein
MHGIGVVSRAFCEIVVLEVSLGDRNMKLSRAAYHLPVGHDDNGSVEAALIDGSGAFEQ